MAEPAPTRRSSRTSAAPSPATTETTGTSRAALRGRTVAATASATATPSSIPVATKTVPVTEPLVPAMPAAAVAGETDAVAVAEAAAVAERAASVGPADREVVAPLSRRARRTTLAHAPVRAVAPKAPAAEEQPQIVPDAEAVSSLLADTVAAFAAAGAEPTSAVAVPAPTSRRRVRPRTPENAAVQDPLAQAAPAPAAPADSKVEELRVVEPEAADRRPNAGTEPVSAAAGDAEAEASVDEFEAAARLFSFTGETSVQAPAPEEPTADTATQPHVAPRRHKAARGASFRKVATASFSVGVFGIVGLMAVGMTTPAEAVAAAGGADASMSVVAPASGTTEIDADEIQAYVAPAGIEGDSLERTENYGTTTTAELASEAGIQNFSNLFHNDPNSPIQWPFAVGVTMSYGFGMRDGRMHEGIDFTPGAGAPIQAIADGTVRVASEAGGAYGVHVIIDHMVDGQLVSSHYAHMQYGSLQVEPGQHVTVGTVLGRTGNTGRSYGAHTHFEILMNGTTAIDPMPWLREHAGG